MYLDNRKFGIYWDRQKDGSCKPICEAHYVKEFQRRVLLRHDPETDTYHCPECLRVFRPARYAGISVSRLRLPNLGG